MLVGKAFTKDALNLAWRV